jgi:methylase of polypeptide subunit release factors
MQVQLEHGGGSFDPGPAKRLLSRNRERTYPHDVSIAGLRLSIDEGVFSPDLTQTSQFMLACLPPLHRGLRVLDVFTGSGIFAVYAASRRCNVVAVDISPLAVRCATRNAAANGVADLVDVRLGDTLDPLATGEVFDLVVATPPLLPGVPGDALETALFDPGLRATIRFLDGLSSHLSTRGQALLILSDVFGRIGYDLDALCAERQLSARLVAVRNVSYEIYSVYELRARTSRDGDDTADRQ